MSLITYPVATQPRVFLPRSFSAALQANTRSFASPFGGSEQVADLLNDRWAFALELSARTHDEAASVEAFVAAMRGMSNTTNLYHFGRPTPRGTLSGSPALVAAAAQGAASITVGAVAGQTLRAGDMLGIGGLLVQVAADCVADASGAMVVPLVNRLRRSVAGLSRASTATYIDGAGVLQTAGVNVPRFQGGELLVEGAATNRFLYSQGDAGAAGFGTTPPTISSGVLHLGVMCSGAEFPAAGNTGFNGSRVIATPSVSVPAGVAAAGSSWLSLSRPLVGNETLGYYWFGFASFLITAGNSADFVGAWRRVSGGNASMAAGLNTSIGYVGTSLNSPVTLYWCRHQWEEGRTTPTSYIPTTTAAVTRAADVVTPVVWDRPTASFRLASQPRVVYVGGYAEGVAMDFVEAIA